MEHGVGMALREARRRRQVDLAQVEDSTKIRGRFLLAIENEEWDALPGEAYVCGFIRTYAGYLGLDGARLVEEYRRTVGASRPGERLLGADPTRLQPRMPRKRRLAPRTLALLVSAALVGILVVIGVLGDGDEPATAPGPQRKSAGGQRNKATATAPLPRREPGLALRLTATEEVWVCLLDGGGEPLVNGQILADGVEAGPFRSDSFTVSLGNGEVSMTVNGQQASIPATSSPIGYTIEAGGALRELPEGERPTCT